MTALMKLLLLSYLLPGDFSMGEVIFKKKMYGLPIGRY